MKENAHEHPESLKQHLSRQFQNRNQKETPPVELKNQVFQSVDRIQLFADMFELFTLDFASSELMMIDIISDKYNITPSAESDEDE